MPTRAAHWVMHCLKKIYRCIQSIHFPLTAKDSTPFRVAELATLAFHYTWLFGAALLLLPFGRVRFASLYDLCYPGTFNGKCRGE